MKNIIRIMGGIVVLLLVLFVVVAAYVFIQSNARLNETWDVQVASIEVSTDEETLLEGERIFISRGCADCHGENGAGTLFIEDPAMGVISADNLTTGEGGIGETYSTEDYIRAIQHGLRPDNTSLIIMPSVDWQQMRSEELAPLIAYIQSLEPIDNVLAERQVGPVARALIAFDQLDLSADLIDHETAGLVDVTYGTTIEYGEYLAAICSACHGQDFAGGIVLDPNSPASANLTPHETGIGEWSYDDFVTAMQTGVNPDGHELRTPMPWEAFTAMNPEELEALYLYFQSIDPVENDIPIE